MIVPLARRLDKVQEYYFSKKLDQIQVMRSQGLSVINLGIGSPDLVPPAEALKAAADTIMKNTSHGYSSYRSTPELRGAMSAWYKKTYSVDLNAESEILPLLGSKEGILYLSMALLNPGDTVLIPNPGYPAYASVAELLGAKIVYYDLTDESEWLPDFKKLESENLENCKLMWVNYPHMPTGKAASLSFFKELIEFGKRNKIVICNDNPYGLILNSTPPLSLFSADPTKEVACELNSLSKSFNMAGWRVGMFMGSAELTQGVLKVKSNVDSGMFLGTQKAAIEALNVSESWHQMRNDIYEKRRNHVWEIFDSLGFSYAKDQVGLFIWAKAPEEIPVVSEFIDKLLLQAHVFLTPGMIFGSNGNRFARASLCASEEQLIEAKKRIKEFLS